MRGKELYQRKRCAPAASVEGGWHPHPPLHPLRGKGEEGGSGGLWLSQRGASIIAVIFLIVVVAFLGVIMVSLYVTQSSQAIGELNSTQALYIADGGVEYIVKNRTFPDYSMLGATEGLGNGTFTVDSPAYTTVVVPSGANVTITVNSTSWFTSNPTAGSGAVGLVIGSEEIWCGSIPNATQFSSCNKILSGAVTGGQPANTEVYALTKLNGVLNPPATQIDVDGTRGFLPYGMLKVINGSNGRKEYVRYTGTTGTAFAGLVRCVAGSDTPCPTATPDDSRVYQYVITSTGTVSTIFGGNAQRVVRVTVD